MAFDTTPDIVINPPTSAVSTVSGPLSNLAAATISPTA